MPRNWEFYNIFGSEPVVGWGRASRAAQRLAKRVSTSGRRRARRAKGAEREKTRKEDGVREESGCRYESNGRVRASREDGYPLFESRSRGTAAALARRTVIAHSLHRSAAVARMKNAHG